MSKINTANIKRLSSYIKRNGLKSSVVKVAERLNRDEQEKGYSQDVFDLLMDKEQEEYERQMEFTHRYKFSILVPTYETGKRRITEMLESVFSQTYDTWELCIADASESDDVLEAVNEIKVKYDGMLAGENATREIKYIRLKENRGISENTNEALKIATGEYIALLDHDDILAKNALFEMAMVLEGGLKSESGFLMNEIKLIYSDEDKCDDNLEKFFDYHKKPDFDIHLLRTNNYICHFLVVRRELALSVGGLNSEYDGAQDHDFILRCVERLGKNQVRHIPKVLYHWRSHISSTATNPDSKLYAYEAGKKAVKSHLERLSIDATVSDTEHLGFFRVKNKVSAEDLTKVVFMDYETLKSKTLTQLQDEEYEYIMVLNDNVKPVNYDFVEEMLGILMHDDVGCVGGLVVSGSKIESAGYSFNEDGNMVADFSGLNKHFSGYLHRAKLTREVDGVCTDCMMVRKSEIMDGGVLNPKAKVVYCPYSVFKRVR